jgi:hypothetical protein
MEPFSLRNACSNFSDSQMQMGVSGDNEGPLHG